MGVYHTVYLSVPPAQRSGALVRGTRGEGAEGAGAAGGEPRCTRGSHERTLQAQDQCCSKWRGHEQRSKEVAYDMNACNARKCSHVFVSVAPAQCFRQRPGFRREPLASGETRAFLSFPEVHDEVHIDIV